MEQLPDDFYHNKLTVDLMLAQKELNANIIALKNFVAKYRPNPNRYKKSTEGTRQFQKDFEEWDKLMRL